MHEEAANKAISFRFCLILVSDKRTKQKQKTTTTSKTNKERN